MPKYNIQITSSARKEIRRLDKPTLKKLDKAIRRLQEDPFFSNTEKLTNHPEAEYRHRIGDWRILFTIIDDIVYVMHVWHRGGDYKK
ncbi:type II toxin-antitoxin system RelE/ParE family toxin [Patescibacteria group bacterium]|nr:type II toxin-antitoxin system RelE/ParE family toxin [Patescibacteria group bacterium]